MNTLHELDCMVDIASAVSRDHKAHGRTSKADGWNRVALMLFDLYCLDSLSHLATDEDWLRESITNNL